MTHFRSRTYEGMIFVSAKIYLLSALVLYVASIYLCDVLADYMSYYVEGALRDLFFPPSWNDHSFGWARFTRRWLIDGLLPYLFLFFIPIAIFRPDSFLFFRGYKNFEEEYLIYSFVRVVRDILFSSIVIAIILGGLQGFFFWAKWGYAFLMSVIIKPEFLNGITSESETLTIIDQQLAWLKPFNISILIICLTRSGILTTIIQGLLYFDERKKLISAVIIGPFLAITIITVSLLIPQKITYVPKPWSKYLGTENISDKPKQERPKPRIFKKEDKSHIFPKDDKSHIFPKDDRSHIFTNDKQKKY